MFLKVVKISVAILACTMLVLDISLHIFQSKNQVGKYNVYGFFVTEDDALGMAKIICGRVFDEVDYENCEWEIFYDGSTGDWVVFLSGNDLGVRLPEIHIKRKNAEIMFLGLQD